MNQLNDFANQNDIAIIGMNFRFPDISTESEFWEMLTTGKENLQCNNLKGAETDDFMKANVSLENADLFSHEFFGYTKSEAELMDPQHRMFLQCAWELLEKAGYNPFDYGGLIGLFAGVSTSTYLINNIMSHPKKVKAAGDLQLSILNEKDHFTAKTAYKLNLKGPCVAVQTVCSTSLVAMHLAGASLQNGECDMALAGGVTIQYPQRNGYHYYQGGILSSDGHIRSFDKNATGTVYSDGLGIVLLKRLEDAIADGDNIRAVIKGSAMNSDGGDKAGYTAPGVNGQIAAITEAQMVSGVLAETIDMIEAHGSGTPLGDEIELDALLQAFGARTVKTSFCALGSVKTNIGHTQNAAGAAGVIKAVLALEHKEIPASLNCQNPNSKLGLDESPFYINTFHTHWVKEDHPRRAGVSAFGLGGVNAHIILEEAPPQTEHFKAFCLDKTETYCLSAMSRNALKKMVDNHLDYLQEHETICLRDAAITLKTGRVSWPYRLAVPFHSKDSLVAGLKTAREELLRSERTEHKLSFKFGSEAMFRFDRLKSEAKSNPLLQETISELSVEMATTVAPDVFIEQYVLFQYLHKLFPEININQGDSFGQLAIQIFERQITLREGVKQAEKGYQLFTMEKEIIPIGRLDGVASMDCVESIISEIWQCGYDVDWIRFYESQAFHHLVLPTYPFELQRYFVEADEGGEVQALEAQELGNGKIRLEQVQKQVQKIWKEKLGVENIEGTDNFFQLGGHSLLVTQVVLAINAEYKSDFPLQSFYDAADLNELSSAVYQHLQTNRYQYDDLPAVSVDVEKRFQPFSLTDVQKAYWIGRNNAMELGNTSTHMYFESDMKALDIDRFTTAFNQMIKRHEMLRAVILKDGTQMIHESVPYYQVACQDIGEADDSGQQAAIAKVREEMSHQVIDCYTWPMFDIRATRLSGNITKLHISIDLLIADAWSLELLLGELSYVYHNPYAVLPGLTLSFRDYVQSLNEIEQTNRFDKSKEYWKTRVKELPPAPMLPLKKDPTTVLTPHFVRHRAIVDHASWTAIKEKAARYKISETVVLLSAFSEVLALWSRKRHFTLNLTVFNRLPIHDQVNDIIGDFTALNLLEVKNNRSLTLAERMKCNQSQLLQDMDHRHYSGVRVTRDLMAEHKNSSRALMPVIFTSILNQKSNSWEGNKSFTEAALQDQDTYSISQTPQVWLDHQVIERNGELMYNWDAVSDIFPEHMIAEMFQVYKQLLVYLAASEEIWEERDPLNNTAFLFPHQKQIRIETPSSGFELPNELLYDSFLIKAREMPNAPALITHDETVNYQELDALSDIIAGQITEVKKDRSPLIAIIMKKGWEQIVAVLSILKAGYAFLPIDSTQPQKRIESILESAEVYTGLVLERNENLTGSMEQMIVDAHLLQEYRDAPEWEISKQMALPDRLKPDDTAYVIYTSGSTGKPKGVVISHRSAMNTIKDINTRFAVCKKDRVLALSSLSFDLSVYDIFGMLSEGAAIVIPDSDKQRDPEHWAKLIREHQVTIWNTVPALMKMITGIHPGNTFDSLRLVFLSGDWIAVDLPQKIWQYNRNIEVISLGGATEASIWSVLYPINKNIQYSNSIPYGKAMVNQKIEILNEGMQLCPIGVPGEIYISGAGLAKGYWKNQEKTDQQFIKNPFTGERVYRTGDMGRYFPDGNIEFLGRQDTQVKVNGYRIELGEIEHVLKKSKYVEDAAVIENGKAAGKQLAAFIAVDKEYAYGLQGVNTEDIILDSVERMQFKLKEYAIREFEHKHRFQLDDTLILQEEYYRHRSYRYFEQDIISFSDFSKMLGSLARMKDDNLFFPKYRYASGGGLYPIQTYLFIKEKRIANLPGGLYYYDPKNHDLVQLEANINLPEAIHEQGNQNIFRSSAFSVFLVGRTFITQKMYGQKDGLDYMKIEAGLISALLETTGLESHIGMCQIGTLDFNRMKSYLDLEEDAQYLHCLVGGKVTKEQMTREGFLKEWNAGHLSDKWKGGEHQGKKGGEHQGKKDISRVLKQELQEELPDYMIPAKIVLVNKIPLTDNGKVDRKALLKQLDQATPEAPISSSHMPQTQAQQMVYEIWKEYFSGKEFGINDNFFDLGGDSIMTVEVYGKLKKVFSKQMNVVDLFSYPTVESLAGFLSNQTPVSTIEEEDEELKRAKKRRQSLNNRNKSNLENL